MDERRGNKQNSYAPALSGADRSEPTWGSCSAIQNGRMREELLRARLLRCLIGRLIALRSVGKERGTSMTLYAVARLAGIVPTQVHISEGVAKLTMNWEGGALHSASFLQAVNATLGPLLARA